TIAVTGTPAAPVADFKLDWKDATTGQTKGAGLAPLGITAGGKFVDIKHRRLRVGERDIAGGLERKTVIAADRRVEIELIVGE
ncbi:hypothetical protein ACC713_37305, partial [Rhizobium johnstonii]|uniref:hypothetical protein n=1 Tax=Rhizobium johnstonii TaxID=3019933 RepID=UPI003F9C16F6